MVNGVDNEAVMLFAVLLGRNRWAPAGRPGMVQAVLIVPFAAGVTPQK